MEPVLGVDIGGTKIRWLILRGGRVSAVYEVKTPHTKGKFLSVLGTIFAAARGRGIGRAGIGFPGTLKVTKIIAAPNLPFLAGLDLRRVVPRGIRIRVDNDARCFACVEAARGAGRRARTVLALTIGTGVGRAYAEKGRVLPLARFSRAEPWERAYQMHHADTPSALARFLAQKLALLIAEISPQVVVIGGGMMRKKDFFPLLRRALRREGISIPVRRSRFRQNAGALGAALLVGK